MSLRLVNWNVEWATTRSPRFPEIRSRIEKHDPDIICLTEAYDSLLSHDGYTICSQPDYGYPIKQGRRKVLLWSKHPWCQNNDLGIDSMPPGRFISGITQTPLGEVTVVGVCIPWAMSRVKRSSIEKRKMWEDHRQYLCGLEKVLSETSTHRLILMGDFNQRLVGPGTAPIDLRSALIAAMPPGVTIATSTLGYQGRRAIDHIALSDDLVVESLGTISNLHGNRKLSDHFGIFAYLSGRDTQITVSQR